jgi:tyrosine-protein kinase Etk/Wzc
MTVRGPSPGTLEPETPGLQQPQRFMGHRTDRSTQSHEVTLRDLVEILSESKWHILASTLIALVAGFAFVLFTEPVYRADALLKVEQHAQGIGGLSDRTELFALKADLNAEIQVLTSRLILGRAVEKLGLDVVGQPLRVPIIGPIVSRVNTLLDGTHAFVSTVRENSTTSNNGPSNDSGIEVGVFSVPAAFFDRKFIVEGVEPQHYRLFDNAGNLLLEGRAGEFVNKQLGHNQLLSLYISRLNAPPGSRFELTATPAGRESADLNFESTRFKFGAYSWGQEAISIKEFELPAYLLGELFTLVTYENGRYALFDHHNRPAMLGVIGRPSTSWLGTNEPENITLYVSSITARPGKRFQISKQPLIEAIENLRDSIKVVGQANQGEFLTPAVIRVSLDGANPGRVADIVNAVIDAYVRHNTALRSSEADKSLTFLQDQIASLDEQIEEAEDALDDYRDEHGSIDLSIQTRTLLEELASVERQLSQLKTDRQSMLHKFGPGHSRIVDVDTKISALEEHSDELYSRASRLPHIQRDISRMSTDVRVKTDLYTFLLNRVQELRMLKRSSVGNVHVVDRAEPPYEPAYPHKGLVIAFSVVIGCLVGLTLAFVRRTLRINVRDPSDIERELGLPILATIPHARKIRTHTRDAAIRDGNSEVFDFVDSSNPAIEGLRTLRAMLHQPLKHARNNLVLVTGSFPSVGKSFVSACLGLLFARTEGRVLVIDGNLRDGSLESHFGLQARAGLSEFLSYNAELSDVVYTTRIKSMDVIPTGAAPPNPSELLLRERFAAGLAILCSEYDRIVIDSPPILAVADASIIAQLAGTSVLVVGADSERLRDIEVSVSRLVQTGTSLCGAVINEAKPISQYGMTADYHRYAYPGIR